MKNWESKQNPEWKYDDCLHNPGIRKEFICITQS